MKLLYSLKMAVALFVCFSCATIAVAQQSQQATDVAEEQKEYTIKPVYNAVQQKVLANQKNTQSSKNKVRSVDAPKYYSKTKRVGDKPYVPTTISTKKKVAKKPIVTTSEEE